MNRDLFSAPMSAADMADELERDLEAWFSALNFQHSPETHARILASLEWPEIEAEFGIVMKFGFGARGDFEDFVSEVRRMARKAFENGLVVEDAKSAPRLGKRKAAEAATRKRNLDLFLFGDLGGEASPC